MRLDATDGDRRRWYQFDQDMLALSDDPLRRNPIESDVPSMEQYDILAIGDLHLGSQPNRVPDELLTRHPLQTISSVAALERCVDVAIDHNVAMVLFAGDVIDRANALFETRGHLQRAVGRLEAAGISSVAIAGNHDADALQKMAKHIDGLHILGGDGGAWEDVIVRRDERAVARVVGWSFAGPKMFSSPLELMSDQQRARSFDDHEAVPVIGLLHCDLDQTDSPYAPVARAELTTTGYDAWLLGHVHRPRVELRPTGTPPIGYLGCVSGVDAGEYGAFGPWLARVSATGAIELDQVLLAPMRYERRDIDISQCADADAVGSAITQTLDDLNRATAEEQPVRVGAARLTLVGRTPAHAGVTALLRAGDVQLLTSMSQPGRGESEWFIEKLVDRSRPEIDLGDLVHARDARAGVAQRLLDLENRTARGDDLIRDAREQLTTQASTGMFRELDRDDIGALIEDDEVVRERLMQSGWRALEALMATHEVGATA